MLPYTPLHHLLLAELGFPVVATSGNLSDEPICTDEHEALERLGGIADVFLVHNRPIVRHVDDSIVRVMLDRELVLRRARGYAPLPFNSERAELAASPQSALRTRPSEIVLAVGAHLKNAVALSVGNQVFISQHIGDLETEPAHAAFRRVIADFEKLYDASRKSSPPICTRIISRPICAGTSSAGVPACGSGSMPTRARRAALGLAAAVRTTLASSITSPMCCPAWRKMKLRRRRSAFRGTAPATAWTARFGAANFSSSPTKASNASRICVHSGCPAATRRSRNRAAPRSDCFTKFSATRFSNEKACADRRLFAQRNWPR